MTADLDDARSPRKGFFISYRRSDSQAQAGRLHDEMARHFGEGRVFIDVADVGVGADFIEAIERTIKASEVALVVIGRDWLTAAEGSGRRLDDPNDFVRMEVAAALRQGLWVIPVLVRGAAMPRASELPDDLKDLARHNAYPLDDNRWIRDVADLIRTIDEKLWGRTVLRRPPYGRIVAVVLLSVLIYALCIRLMDIELVDAKFTESWDSFDRDAEDVLDLLLWLIPLMLSPMLGAGYLAVKWRGSGPRAYALIGLIIAALQVAFCASFEKQTTTLDWENIYVGTFLSSWGMFFAFGWMTSYLVRKSFSKTG